MLKRPIFQEDITILTVHTPNNRATKYMRQKLIELQRETDKSTIIVGDLTLPTQKWTELAGRKSVWT